VPELGFDFLVKGTTIKPGDDPKLVDKKRMRLWEKWWWCEVKPTDDFHQFLAVRQTDPFTSDYHSFQVRVNFGASDPIKVTDAVAFLVKDYSIDSPNAPSFRVLNMPRDKNGLFMDLVNLENPNEGESLLILVRLESADKITKLPASAKGFYVTLEVQK
jgi:hypothetical protein